MKEDKETKLFKAFQNGVKEGKQEAQKIFENSKEFADMLEKERFEGIKKGKQEAQDKIINILKEFGYLGLIKLIKQELKKDLERGKGGKMKQLQIELADKYMEAVKEKKSPLEKEVAYWTYVNNYCIDNFNVQDIIQKSDEEKELYSKVYNLRQEDMMSYGK